MKKLIQKIKKGKKLQILRELRWIGAYGRRYIWAIGWFILIGVASTLLGLGASVVSKDIIDIVTGYQTGRVLWVAIAYVLMQIVKIVLTAISSRISAKVQLRVRQDLRFEIFQNIMNAQWEPLSRYHSGDLLARSSRDAETVASGIITWVPSLVINLLQFVGIFCVLAWFDYTLALLALASAPVMLLFSGFLTRRVRNHSEQMRNIGAEMTSFHSETFRNIQFIKSIHALDLFRDKLTSLQKKYKDATLNYNLFSVLTSSALSLLGMLVSGACFFWSLYRLWTNNITFGEMTLFLQLSGGLSGAFSALVALVPTAITAATAAGRIMEVTQIPAENLSGQEEVSHLLHSGQNTVTIQAKALDFSYPSGNHVISQAEFTANPGEIVAFVGHSGGGKTTLLRLLLGIVTAQSGSIEIRGGDPEVTLCASAATRNLFAYVPQENTLFSGTIAQNLRVCAPDASDADLEEVLKAVCAYDFVSALPEGIHAKIGEGGNGLSEGQVQRLSIARALLTEAPVLLLDEATSALDVQTEQELLRNVMQHRNGRTCIVTTHRPSVLASCDRVYRIENSRMSQLGTEEIRQLLTK